MDLEKHSNKDLMRLMIGLIYVLSLFSFLEMGAAQQNGTVQVVTGYIEKGSGDVYKLDGLRQGDVLYVYAKGTSGNLDPLVAWATVT